MTWNMRYTMDTTFVFPEKGRKKNKKITKKEAKMPDLMKQQPDPVAEQPAKPVADVEAAAASTQPTAEIENIPPASLSAEQDLRIQWILSKVTQSLQVSSKLFYDCLNRNDKHHLNELAAVLNGNTKITTALFSAKYAGSDKPASLDMFVVDSVEELSKLDAVYFIRLESAVSMPVSKDGRLFFQFNLRLLCDVRCRRCGSIFA